MSMNNNDFVSFLEDYLMAEEAAELEIKVTGDVEEDAPLIDSPQKANYFLKLALRVKEDIDNINSLCDAEISKVTERVNKFRENEVKSLSGQYTYYEKLLKNYTEKELVTSNKKSVKLPYGTLSLRKQKEKWEYGDEKELIEYLKEHGLDSLVNKKETFSIDKKLLKECAENSSEGMAIPVGDVKVVLPGVTVVEQEDKFSIK